MRAAHRPGRLRPAPAAARAGGAPLRRRGHAHPAHGRAGQQTMASFKCLREAAERTNVDLGVGKMGPGSDGDDDTDDDRPPLTAAQRRARVKAKAMAEAWMERLRSEEVEPRTVGRRPGGEKQTAAEKTESDRANTKRHRKRRRMEELEFPEFVVQFNRTWSNQMAPAREAKARKRRKPNPPGEDDSPREPTPDGGGGPDKSCAADAREQPVAAQQTAAPVRGADGNAAGSSGPPGPGVAEPAAAPILAGSGAGPVVPPTGAAVAPPLVDLGRPVPAVAGSPNKGDIRPSSAATPAPPSAGAPLAEDPRPSSAGAPAAPSAGAPLLPAQNRSSSSTAQLVRSSGPDGASEPGSGTSSDSDGDEVQCHSGRGRPAGGAADGRRRRVPNPAERERLLEWQQGDCAECEKKILRRKDGSLHAEADHMRQRGRGQRGSEHWWNFQMLHLECHGLKGLKDKAQRKLPRTYTERWAWCVVDSAAPRGPRGAWIADRLMRRDEALGPGQTIRMQKVRVPPELEDNHDPWFVSGRAPLDPPPVLEVALQFNPLAEFNPLARFAAGAPAPPESRGTPAPVVGPLTPAPAPSAPSAMPSAPPVAVLPAPPQITAPAPAATAGPPPASPPMRTVPAPRAAAFGLRVIPFVPGEATDVTDADMTGAEETAWLDDGEDTDANRRTARGEPNSRAVLGPEPSERLALEREIAALDREAAAASSRSAEASARAARQLRAGLDAWKEAAAAPRPVVARAAGARVGPTTWAANQDSAPARRPDTPEHFSRLLRAVGICTWPPVSEARRDAERAAFQIVWELGVALGIRFTTGAGAKLPLRQTVSFRAGACAPENFTRALAGDDARVSVVRRLFFQSRPLSVPTTMDKAVSLWISLWDFFLPHVATLQEISPDGRRTLVIVPPQPIAGAPPLPFDWPELPPKRGGGP